MKKQRRSIALLLVMLLILSPTMALANENGTETTICQTDGSMGDITVGIIKNGEAMKDVSGSYEGETTTNITGKLKKDNAADYDQVTTITDPNRSATASATIKHRVSAVETDTNGKPIVPENEEGYVYYVQQYWNINNQNNGGYSVSTKLLYWETVDETTGNETNNIKNYLNEKGKGYDTSHAGTYNIVLGPNQDSLDKDDLIGGLYCVDWNTDTTDNVGYHIVSLEDAAGEGYYTTEQAYHLRAILKNGYDWSVDSGEDTPGTASLKKFKAILTKALESGAIPGVTQKDIDNLSRNDAAAITQIALWTYANRIEVVENEELHIYVADGNGGKSAINPVYTAMAQYLASLIDDGSNDHQTIPYSEENFVNNMKLFIGSMVSGESNNKDDNPDNDIYHVGLKFSLKVTPGSKDDLIIQVLNENGEIVKTARIAGDDETTGYGYAKTETAEDGTVYYVLDGLTLQENSDSTVSTFSLKLTGVQQLEEGIYVFQSRETQAGESASQNLIGRYQGGTEVDVCSDITLRFDVQEGTVKTIHEWYSESGSSSGGSSGSSSGGDSSGSSSTSDLSNPTDVEELGNDDNDTETSKESSEPTPSVTLDIEEEPVPLATADMLPADVPQTGDASGMELWIALACLSLIGMAGVTFGRKHCILHHHK